MNECVVQLKASFALLRIYGATTLRIAKNLTKPNACVKLIRDAETSEEQGKQLFQRALSILYVQFLPPTLLSNTAKQLNTCRRAVSTNIFSISGTISLDIFLFFH